MNIQVLVATMHQPKGDYSLLEKMNIQSDAIICNQCERNEFEEFVWNGHVINWLSFSERGVGLNRNNALMRASSDIIMFADDDVQYINGYPKIITDYYTKNPKADAVIFNFLVKRGNEEFEQLVDKKRKLNRKTATKFPTYCISCKNSQITRKNIYFHREFGGGTKFSHGEDSIFLQDCLKSGLRMYTSDEIVGKVDHGASTWFKGYDSKYFSDKGVLFYKIVGALAPLVAAYHCFKHRSMYKEYGWKKGMVQMWEGIKKYKSMDL